MQFAQVRLVIIILTSIITCMKQVARGAVAPRSRFLSWESRSRVKLRRKLLVLVWFIVVAPLIQNHLPTPVHIMGIAAAKHLSLTAMTLKLKISLIRSTYVMQA